MKRPEPDSPEAQHRANMAAEWLARRDRGLTPAEQDEFLDWLAADPRHGEWFAVHRQTVGDFSALAQWRPEHSAEPNPDLLAPSGRSLRWFIPVVVAAAAAVVFGLVLRWPNAGTPEATVSVDGTLLERRLLPDGSAIELNRNAMVTVNFTRSERRVALDRGEAYFTVEKDPARPFIVRAGGVDVRAVGTAFSVRLDAGSVEVLVTHGRVGVQHEPAGTASSADGSAAPPTFVDAGQRAVVSRATSEPPVIAPASSGEMTGHLGWQPRLLDFSSAPLATAVAEFNRRNRVQFVIADAELGAMPVVASIRSDNVEGFAQFLAAAPGVEIERRPNDQIIVRRKR